MIELKTKITELTGKKARSGTDYWVGKADNLDFRVFDAALAATLDAARATSRQVKVGYDIQPGQGTFPPSNIVKEVELIGAPVPESVTAENPWPDKDLRMVRSTAWKAATSDVVGLALLRGELEFKTVRMLARKIAEDILEGTNLDRGPTEHDVPFS